MFNAVKKSLIYSLISGILLGIPCSLLLCQIFALNAKSEVIENIFYYFNPINYVYVICADVIVLFLALIPCMVSLYKTKNNIIGNKANDVFVIVIIYDKTFIENFRCTFKIL